MAGRSGRVRLLTAVALIALAATARGALAQEPEPPRNNPLQGNATAIKQGQNIYRGRCGVCHGIDAKGYRGSDLTTGDWVHGGTDVVKALMVGADVAMVTSAVLEHGPAHFRLVEHELRTWMAAHEYESVDQLRGSASQTSVADPSAFERANYIRTLQSWGTD